MSRRLTIRRASEEVGRRLEIFEGAAGVDERRARLARYATWTPEDLSEFNEALAAQRPTDDPLWLRGPS